MNKTLEPPAENWTAQKKFHNSLLNIAPRGHYVNLIKEAKRRCPIPWLWDYYGLPGKPGRSCRSPFREDRHPSFSISPDGQLFNDFATGEGGDVVSFLELAAGLSNKEACRTLIDLADLKGSSAIRISKRRVAPSVKAEGHSDHLIPQQWSYLKKGTDAELKALSDLLDIGIGGLQLASERGFLWFFNNSYGQRCWSITDAARYVRQDRTLSGDDISISDDSSAKQRTVRKAASWPVGAADIGDKPVVIFCEGSSDSLAAHQLISCHSREKDTAVVAMLGASQSIHEAALPHFRDRTVIIFPDYDSAGIAAAVMWKKQLETAGASVTLFDFIDLFRDDGQPVNDLRDFLRVDADPWHNDSDPCVRWSIPEPVKRGGEPC